MERIVIVIESVGGRWEAVARVSEGPRADALLGACRRAAPGRMVAVVEERSAVRLGAMPAARVGGGEVGR